MQFSVKAPASSANLGPGFDALGLALDLWNTITIDTDGPAGEVINTGTESALLDGRENLAITAMEHLAKQAGKPLPTLSMVAETNIPVARGLGSSAAALVAGLVAANELLQLNLSRQELFQQAWAIEGHGDNVGAAMFGGAVLAVPNVHHVVTLNQELDLEAVLFVPEVTGATWAARAALPGTVPLHDAVQNVACVSSLVVGLTLGDRELISAGMRDMLHEPYRARLFPHLDPMKSAAMKAGATGAALSGAGPTVLTLVETDLADQVAAVLTATGNQLELPGVVMKLRPTSCGASLIQH